MKHQMESQAAVRDTIEERRRVVEETEVYAKNVSQVLANRYTSNQDQTQGNNNSLSNEPYKHSSFQNGLKTYNTHQSSSHRHYQNRNANKSGQASYKAAKELDNAVEDLVKVSQKYHSKKESKDMKLDHQRVILAASPT